MTIIVVGLNHRSAPLEVRERLALSGRALEEALGDLHSGHGVMPDGELPYSGITEGIFLSTCNRTEIYAVVTDAARGRARVEEYLSALHGTSTPRFREYLYVHTGEDAVNHLMRVACGLDSMILGEAEVLGQVKAALETALRARTAGPLLSRLFTQAARAGKRARTESAISRYSTSVSHAGAQLMVETLGGPAHILVVGAGEMAKLAARTLTRTSGCELIFINRTFERAEQMAGACGGRALPWLRLEEALLWADGVLCATGAPHPVIYRRDLEGVMSQRVTRPLLVVDVAVPRDVEASAASLDGVSVFDIDDLRGVVDGNLALREAAIPQVETIIGEEMGRFAEWTHGRQVAPVIKELREWARGVAQEEMQQVLARLPGADERTRRLVGTLAHRIVNRLLHEPTTRLRFHAVEGNGQVYAAAIQALFPLDEISIPNEEVSA